MLSRNEYDLKCIIGIVMYLLTFYIKGKFRGWKSLSEIYLLPDFKGEKIKEYRDLRLRINDFKYYGRYKKAVNIKVFEKGIELQKILPLQMKNFAIFLKWEDIIMAKKRNFMGISTLIISLKNDYILFDRKTEVNMLAKYINEYTNFKI